MSITRLSPISTRSFSLLEKQALAGYRPHFPTQGKTWAQLHPNGPRKRKLPTPTPSPTPWTADFEPLGGETSRHDVTSFEEGLEEEGGWYEKSEKEGVSLTKERKRELWADPYVRMLQEEKTLCLLSGELLPNALVLKLRSALHRPSPSEHESFFYVPDEILSPEFDTSSLRPPPEKGLPPQRGPSVALLDESLKILDLAGARHTRLNQAELPSSEPLRPVIPLGASLDPKDNVPTEHDLEKRRTSQTPGAAVTHRLLPLLQKQIREQLLTRVQQELEILVERAQLSEGVEGRMVLREVGAEEREAMRDEDWRDEGRKVVAVLEVGTPKEEVGQFFHSTPPIISSPSPPSFPPPPEEKNDQDFRKESILNALRTPAHTPSTKRPKYSPVPQTQLSFTHITCPLLKNLATPPPPPPTSDEAGNLETVLSSPSPPLASPSIPYYPLSHLFPSSQSQSHILSRLIYLSHLSSIPNFSDPIPPLVPSSPPSGIRTFALLSHPSLLGPHGIDTYPLFRALWRVRLWETDAGGWDEAARNAVLNRNRRGRYAEKKEVDGDIAPEKVDVGSEEGDEDDVGDKRKAALARLERLQDLEEVEVEEKGGDDQDASGREESSESTPWPSTERLIGGEISRPREPLQNRRGERQQAGSNFGGEKRGGGGSSRDDFRNMRPPPPHQDPRGGGGYGNRGGGGGRGGRGGFGSRS